VEIVFGMKKALIKKKISLDDQIRNVETVFGMKKALIEKKISLRDQSRNAEIVFGIKKALIEKIISLRQSYQNQIKPGKKKRNTGSAEAFLMFACLHPRTHLLPRLYLGIYSF
jgi:hypothetical protein